MSPGSLSPPAGSTVVVGEQLAGRYRLDDMIGSGGMSTVYRAFDCELERVVAVKLLHAGMALDSASVARFQREAITGASLPHENIVAVLDRGTDRGRPFIVQEYAGAANLKQLLAETGPLDLDQALELTIQVARGLAYAHSHGYVHRDVKPQNILVDGRRAKLADFGIARSLAQTDAPTLAGTILGSADSISPEQAQGKPVDERSDVYSLGAVLYELLTGMPPFTGDSFVSIAMQHVTSPPPPPRRLRPLPPRVDLAVRKALAKDPARRFRSMDAFAAELEACLAQARGRDSGDTAILPALPATHAHRLGSTAAVVTFVAAAGALAFAGLYLPGGSNHPVVEPPSSKPHPAAPAPRLVSVPLRAAAAYDPPPGDGVEDNAGLAMASDGNAGTAWSTEGYATAAFGNLKHGVGIVLDAGRPVTLASLTVRSDTPGFRADVQAGRSPGGPFEPLSKPRPVESKRTFVLSSHARSRYYLVWITALSPSSGPGFHADVNEVTARGPAAAAR